MAYSLQESILNLDFNFAETFQALVDLIGTFAGAEMMADDVTELGKKVLKMERDFNEKAGFTSKDDRLPEFFTNEALPPHHRTFKVTDQELDQVHNY